MEFQRINNLDVIVKNKEGQKAVVLLHGYGADFRDLVPVVDFISGQAAFTWYFPNGVMDLPPEYGGVGRAWFEIDLFALQRAVINRDFKSYFDDHVPVGFQRSRDLVTSLLEELSQRHDEVILGGFSQGAMISVHVALGQNSYQPKRAIFLSGALPAKKELRLKEQLELSVFQSHGTQDMTLPVDLGRGLKEFLVETNINVSYHEFMGAHEIPVDIIKKLGQFLIQ